MAVRLRANPSGYGCTRQRALAWDALLIVRYQGDSKLMRLGKFEVHNFKGIEDASFEWDDIVVLIGENNAGKSTVLQALQWSLGGSQLKDEAVFRDNMVDEQHAIELVGYFDQLTPEEQQAPAVRGRMNGDLWIIKKRFWAEEAGAGERSWKEQYYSYSSEEKLVGWPDPDNSWAAFPPEYQGLISQIPNRGSRPNQQTRERLRELVREQKPELVESTEAKWIENPGGGGNWKSNANSIVPRLILVKAVQDAAEEAVSKEASAYGKIVSLIVERRLMNRPEVVELKARMEEVLKLFRPDPEHPERQAEEIREVERRINALLGEVIGGIVSIETTEPDIRPVLLPSTTLMVKDRADGVRTEVSHQGHGLQRTLIMTLLQILAGIQSEPTTNEGGAAAQTLRARSVILGIEEPELYMHPQMERKMRDALYRLASQPGAQVICTTHSPVFLDMGQRHKSIVRVVKDGGRRVSFFQVTKDLFTGPGADVERDRLRLLSTFNPSVNEAFFARRVALLEEQSAIAAFERGADLTGLFERHPHSRRDVTLIDAQGKGNIPLFQQVLNHFQIPYTVIHDEDQGNPLAPNENATIGALLAQGHKENNRYMISPTNLEASLGIPSGKDRVYRALRRVEELHAAGDVAPDFLEVMNWIYFGQAEEPPVVA